MIGWSEIYIIKVALYQKVLSPEDLRTSLIISEKQSCSLYHLLWQQGLLQTNLLEKIQLQAQSLAVWPDRPQNVLQENRLVFEKLKSYADPQVLHKNLEVTQKMASLGRPSRLHELLIEKGVLSIDQAKGLLGLEKSAIYSCPKCQISLTVADTLPWRRYPCFFCDQFLLKERYPSTHQTQTSMELNSPKHKTGLTQEFGRYQLLKQLGQGGMGMVYLAYDPLVQRELAIKILMPSGDMEQTQKRFKREVQLASKLRHTNIVPIYEVGQANNFLFYTMDYIQGEDLRHYVEGKGKMSQNRALKIIDRVCDAIGYAHKHDILHRDIKPENILVDDKMTPHLVDFGLAKVISQQDIKVTKSGAVVGSPEFMSPEQAKGKKQIDFRVDVYSLGATLYFLLAGKPPFTGTEFMEVIFKVIGQEAPKLSKSNPLVSQETENLVSRCLAKDPEDRYKTVEDLQKDIQALIRGENLTKTSLSLKIKFPQKPNQLKMIALALGFVVIVLGVLVGPSLFSGPPKEVTSTPSNKSLPPKKERFFFGEIRELCSKGKWKEALQKLEQRDFGQLSSEGKGNLYFWSALVDFAAFLSTEKSPVGFEKKVEGLFESTKIDREIPEELHKILLFYPENFETYSALELSFPEKARLATALENFKKASAFLNDPALQKTLTYYQGLVQCKRGEFTEARRSLTKSLEGQDPGQISYFYLHAHLARIYLILSNIEGAREKLEVFRNYSHFHASQIQSLKSLTNSMEKIKEKASILKNLKSNDQFSSIIQDLIVEFDNLGKNRIGTLPAIPLMLQFLEIKSLVYQRDFFKKWSQTMLKMGFRGVFAMTEGISRRPEATEKILTKTLCRDVGTLMPHLLKILEMPHKGLKRVALGLLIWGGKLQDPALLKACQENFPLAREVILQLQRESPEDFKDLLAHLLNQPSGKLKALGEALLKSLVEDKNSLANWKTIRFLLSLSEKTSQVDSLIARAFQNTTDLNIKEKLAERLLKKGKTSVPYFLEALEARDSSTPFHAVRSLIRLDATGPMLNKLASLKTLSSSVVYGLKEAPTSSIKGPLLDFLTSGETKKQIFGLTLCARLESRSSFALPQITTLLTSPKEEIRQKAIEALGTFGKEALPVLPNLKQALSDSNPKVRKAAQKAIKAVEGQ